MINKPVKSHSPTL